MAESVNTPEELMRFVVGLQDSGGSPRRQLTWRVGDALRTVIEQLVSTTATDDELMRVAENLEGIGQTLSAYPHGRHYQGVSEASTRGHPSSGTNTPSERTEANRVNHECDCVPQNIRFASHFLSRTLFSVSAVKCSNTVAKNRFANSSCTSFKLWLCV